MNRPLLLVLAFLPSALVAQTNVAAWLGREITGPNAALAEVQAFTESRVPAMPAVKSGAEWEKLARQLRREVLEKVIFRGEAAPWRDAKTRVECQCFQPLNPGFSVARRENQG